MDNGRPQFELDLDSPPDPQLVDLFRRTAPVVTLDLDELASEGPRKHAAPLKSLRRMRSLWNWVATVVSACVLTAVGLWMSIKAPQLLLAQVGDELGRISSYRCTALVPVPSGRIQSVALYWAAPRSFRNLTRENGALVWETRRPADKRGIEIHYRTKSFSRLPVSYEPLSPLLLLPKLARFHGNADRDLGKSKIGTVDVQGFEIAIRKVDADIQTDGKVRIWADTKTFLPVKVEVELRSGIPAVVMDSFVWNERPDKWFDTTPPAGFREVERPKPAPDEMVEKITEALRTYAKYCGGHYPRVKHFSESVRWELQKAAGVDRIAINLDTPDKEKKAYFEVQDTSEGFFYLNLTLRDNADAAYYGTTVGPADKRRVLFCWKLDAGDYMVIYGDLRHETVSHHRLQELKRE